MNAHALLSAQGWRGHGHSLHKTSDSIGLSKPLLLNRKDNTKGLGTSSHFNADQWWLNAFDEQLKGLETSKKGHVKQTVTTGKLNTVEVGGLGKYSVYNSFVKGGFLEGTLDLLKKQAGESTGDDSASSDGSKQKRTETKEERKQRKEEKRQRKEQRAVRREARHAQRAMRKEARRKIREIRRQVRQEKRSAKEERRRRKETKVDSSSSEESTEDPLEKEKRLRRSKKDEKRKQRAAES